MAAKRALILNEKDSVANVLEPITAGDEVAARLGDAVDNVTALDDIPFGFKVALADVPKGGFVYKYGEAIGRASQDIHRGELVHVHNLEGARGRGDLAKAGA